MNLKIDNIGLCIKYCYMMDGYLLHEARKLFDVMLRECGKPCISVYGACFRFDDLLDLLYNFFIIFLDL